jgi:sugar lactone lactonase YvrE
MDVETTAELILPVGAECGEGPVWHNGALWFVDIEGRRLHRFDPVSKASDQWDAGQRVGVAVPASDGRWMVGLQDCAGLWDPDSGELERICAPEANRPRNRFNDGKCDPHGRFYAGTMSLDMEEGRGALYRIDADGGCHTLVEQVSISNGLAWNAALETMYYIDTGTPRVDAFRWDAETGAISERRTVYEFEPGHFGAPDGMCIDVTGQLWVALWGGSGVVCVDPIAGVILHRINVPTEHVTSCCFGGPTLEDLYITSARQGLSAEQLERQPGAGCVFRARPGVAGLGCDRYRVE